MTRYHIRDIWQYFSLY